MQDSQIFCRSVLGGASLLLAVSGCGDDGSGLGKSSGALTATCVAPDRTLPADAWLCPAPRSVECVDGTGTATPPTLYVRGPATGLSCVDQTLTVEVDPLTSGQHDVVVRDPSGALLCETELTVTDDTAPVLTPRPLIQLWPPNHKFHTIRVEDCFAVSDACQSNLNAEFVWASSDEPIDSIGDGHHAPDIQVSSCRAIALRAERQGPKDGRVYKLGVRVVDAGGNATESVCTVIVDHDQRGVIGADSGEAYRVLFDGKLGLPLCDGENPPPVQTPPVQTPPVQTPPVQTPPVTPPNNGPTPV